MASADPIPQNVAQAIIAPVMMGDSFNILLYGFVLCTFWHHIHTYSWSHSSVLRKAITHFVVALATFMVALDLHDIWHYSTLQQRDLISIINGTLIECFKPAILGVIGVTVQGVLVERTSKAIPNRLWRAAYLVLFGALMVLELFGAAAATAWSVHFHRTLSFSDWFGLDFSWCIAFWQWCAGATDLTITTIYLIVIRQKLKGGGEVVESVLSLIVRLTLQSALPTTIFALATAILTQIVRTNSLMTELVPYALWNPLPSLYALSLFTTLSIAEQAAAQTTKVWSPSVAQHSRFTNNSHTNSHSHSHSHTHGQGSFVGSHNPETSTNGHATGNGASNKPVKVPLQLGDLGGHLSPPTIGTPRSERDGASFHFVEQMKEKEEEKEETRSSSSAERELGAC